MSHNPQDFPPPPAATPPQLSPDAPAAKNKPNKTLWFVLGGMLLMCCICSGIVAVIAVPNYKAEMERAQLEAQHYEALEEMFMISFALDDYYAAHGRYPDAPEGDTTGLAAVLIPNYTHEVATIDPWGGPYEYYVWYDEDDDSYHYQLICRGSDLTPDDGIYGPYEGLEKGVSCFEDDFVIWDGLEYVYSEYEMKKCS